MQHQPIPNGELSEATGPALSPLSVLSLPAHLKSTYRRIVLISHRDQLCDLALDDEETLIVTSDWLAWRMVVDRSGHALHYESMLADWPAERGDPDEHYLNCCDWMVMDGLDVTRFRGVSLGKQFYGHLPLLRHAYLRLWHALDRLCLRYRPRELDYRDLRVEYDFLDFETVRNLVRDIATRHHLRLLENPRPPPRDQCSFPVSGYPGRPVKQTGVKRCLRSIYLRLIDCLFSIRDLAGAKKPRLLVMLNWSAVEKLIEHFHNRAISPVLVADYWPKNPAFVADCWRRGIILARLPGARLDAADNRAIDDMVDRLQAAWAERGTAVEEAERQFLRQHVIRTGWLHARALEVKRYERLFRRLGIARILVGAAESATCRLMLELGVRFGAPTDECLNGAFMTGQRCDVRLRDARNGTAIARLLSWGEQNEAWLRVMGSDIEFVRTGNPAVIPAVIELKPAPQPDRTARKALILPIMVDGHDMRGLFSNTFSQMVDVARVLKAAGYDEIRVKPHPGFTEIAPYFEEVLDYHGLESVTLVTGSLAGQVGWADLVVGPANSGAFMETLGLGKPYYAFRGVPSSLRQELMGGATVFTSALELGRALEKHEVPDSKSILRTLCSVGDIPNAATCVWDAVEQGVADQAQASLRFRLFSKPWLDQAFKGPARFVFALIGDAILFACFVLRPIIRIRFAHFTSERIGSHIGSAEYWLCRQQLKEQDNSAKNIPSREFNVFIASPHMCANHYLIKMMGRRFNLLNSRVASSIFHATRNRRANDAALIYNDEFGKLGSHDYEVWERTELQLLSLTDEERRRGTEVLESIGIPLGEPFICFAVRDKAYLDTHYSPEKQPPPKPADFWSYFDYRDIELETYLPMAEHFASLGFWVLRMGAVVERPLSTDNPRIIDYAWNNRSDFGDIYLLSHCKFYVGDTAGIFTIPQAFNVPFALANLAPNYNLTRGPGCLFMPRIYRHIGESRSMHYREVFESGVERFSTTQKYEDAGVELIANTPEEITAMAVELNARIDGTWVADAGDDELQKQFWSCYPSEHEINSVPEAAARKGYTNVAAGFLRQTRDLVG